MNDECRLGDRPDEISSFRRGSRATTKQSLSEIGLIAGETVIEISMIVSADMYERVWRATMRFSLQIADADICVYAAHRLVYNWFTVIVVVRCCGALSLLSASPEVQQ